MWPEARTSLTSVLATSSTSRCTDRTIPPPSDASADVAVPHRSPQARGTLRRRPGRSAARRRRSPPLRPHAQHNSPLRARASVPSGRRASLSALSVGCDGADPSECSLQTNPGREREREREREGEREGGRQADRQTDRQTDRQRDRPEPRRLPQSSTTEGHSSHTPDPSRVAISQRRCQRKRGKGRQPCPGT